MATTPPEPLPHTTAAAPLCPACGNPVVQITASVEVQYQVMYESHKDELSVIGEQIGDGCWDDRAPATCPNCGWHGEAHALQPKAP